MYIEKIDAMQSDAMQSDAIQIDTMQHIPSKETLMRFKGITDVVLNQNAMYKLIKIKDEEMIIVVLPPDQS